MPQNEVLHRLAWEDRWTQPDLADLIAPLQEQSKGPFEALMGQIETLLPVRRDVKWCGPAWKWTIRYTSLDSQEEELDLLAYLVPNSVAPLVCIPMANNIIERLPMRRLNRFIRNGIGSAKCAVATHWAEWNLTADGEANHLMDIIKRKHKILLDPVAKS